MLSWAAGAFLWANTVRWAGRTELAWGDGNLRLRAPSCRELSYLFTALQRGGWLGTPGSGPLPLWIFLTGPFSCPNNFKHTSKLAGEALAGKPICFSPITDVSERLNAAQLEECFFTVWRDEVFPGLEYFGKRRPEYLYQQILSSHKPQDAVWILGLDLVLYLHFFLNLFILFFPQ